MVSGISGFPFVFYLSFVLSILAWIIGKGLKLRNVKIGYFAFYGFLAPLVWFFIQRMVYFALTEFVSYEKNGTLITTKSCLPFWAMFLIPIILTVSIGLLAYKLLFWKKSS